MVTILASKTTEATGAPTVFFCFSDHVTTTVYKYETTNKKLLLSFSVGLWREQEPGTKHARKTFGGPGDTVIPRKKSANWNDSYYISHHHQYLQVRSAIKSATELRNGPPMPGMPHPGPPMPGGGAQGGRGPQGGMGIPGIPKGAGGPHGVGPPPPHMPKASKNTSVFSAKAWHRSAVDGFLLPKIFKNVYVLKLAYQFVSTTHRNTSAVWSSLSPQTPEILQSPASGGAACVSTSSTKSMFKYLEANEIWCIVMLSCG